MSIEYLLTAYGIMNKVFLAKASWNGFRETKKEVKP